MKKYLVDTTLLIQLYRRSARADEFLIKMRGIVLSFITIAELIQGCRNQKEISEVMNLAKQYDMVWGSAESNQLALDLFARHRVQDGIDFLDAVQASLALQEHLILITDNIKHFRVIPGLIIKTPIEVLQGEDGM